jgi:hypothetical protein
MKVQKDDLSAYYSRC